MKVVIAGATGFLGQPLARALAADGRDIVILTRRTDPPRSTSAARFLTWRPGHPGPWAAEIEGAAAVVNLAGESIGDSRWSKAQKQRILDSRVQATRTLADAILGVTPAASGAYIHKTKAIQSSAESYDIDREHALVNWLELLPPITNSVIARG